MKEFSFLAREGEDRDERQEDDRHRKEYRTADKACGFEHGPPYEGAIVGVDAPLLDVAERILRDDDPGIDQHADRDRDTGKTHDVRRDPGVIHAEKRPQ